MPPPRGGGGFFEVKPKKNPRGGEVARLKKIMEQSEAYIWSSLDKAVSDRNLRSLLYWVAQLVIHTQSHSHKNSVIRW